MVAALCVRFPCRASYFTSHQRKSAKIAIFAISSLKNEPESWFYKIAALKFYFSSGEGLLNFGFDGFLHRANVANIFVELFFPHKAKSRIRKFSGWKSGWNSLMMRSDESRIIFQCNFGVRTRVFTRLADGNSDVSARPSSFCVVANSVRNSRNRESKLCLKSNEIAFAHLKFLICYSKPGELSEKPNGTL